ncbi:hypothetical protein BDV96DRAFT_655198 [Lophiotrema nucula]|uniref:Heterokaryon incompatibility domain-containing protein n=1 Tax=Lophiotrema nucula TaxID=690887 RepID=A0A6A5YGT0_9PLEO|nr:hypothetical protein BDV96DRAFT_655198 [Lophiotrema nucula]
MSIMGDDDVDSKITISVGDRTWAIFPDDLLETCWTDALDSNCEVCGQDFDPPNQPPIRTFSLEPQTEEGIEAFYVDLTADARARLKSFNNPEFSESERNRFAGFINFGPNDFIHQDDAPTLIAIRFRNRHLKCIKEKGVQYIPVSHAWDEEISVAHLSKVASDEAKELVFEEALGILAAVAERQVDRFQVSAELWYDYVSVPQWNSGVQKRLLVQLPEIFASVDTSLIYLDDVRYGTLKCIASDILDEEWTRQYDDELKLSHLEYFYDAYWHKRMWCALEYGHCNDPWMLTEDYHIVSLNNDPNLKHSIVDMNYIIMRPFIAQIDKESAWIRSRMGLKFSGMLRKEPGLTFGEVWELIASRQCRDDRDRYLAIASFLDLASYEILCTALETKSPDEFCIWVWTTALERGDCTPLLLVRDLWPRIDGAQWVTGRTFINPEMYGLGGQVHSASGFLVSTFNHSLKLCLQSVGKIERVIFKQIFGTEEDAFEDILELALSCDSRWSATDFFNAIDCILPLRSRRVIRPLPLQPFRELAEIDPDLTQKLQLHFMSDISDSARTKYEAKDLIKLFRIHSENGELETGRLLALKQFQSHVTTFYSVAVAAVRCHGCHLEFPFHVEISGRPSSTAEVYRFPGLQYYNTLSDGVGIIVSDGRIVGRMIYGTPACDCDQMMEVELR